MANRKASVASRLKSLQKEWKEAEPRIGGARLPDATYNARIGTPVVEESKASQRLQVNWPLTVIDGDYADKKLNKYDGIEDADGLAWLQGTLEILELEIPEDVTDLGSILQSADGLLVEITLQTKDEFQNIYFNELLEADEEEDEEEEDEEEEDEEEEDEEEE